MGCYSDNSTGRSLAWRQDQVGSTSLTIETCLLACKKEGYSFAGVEFGQECYCGVVLGNGTLALPDGSCTFPCTGNVNETVGEHPGVENLLFWTVSRGNMSAPKI